MIEMCPYCELDTSGNHKPGCPNSPVEIVYRDDKQTIYSLQVGLSFPKQYPDTSSVKTYVY